MTDYLSALDRPIAFHRVFVDVTGSVAGAVYLSQLLYWHRRMGREFYKTLVEWNQETGLSRREQENVRKELQRRKILTVKRKGVPARLYYTLHEEALNRTISQFVTSDKLVCNGVTNKNATPEQTITETTAETTAEKKENSPNGEQKKPADDLKALVSPDVLADFREHRRRKKAPLTDTAIKRLVNQLQLCQQRGIDPDEALGEAMERGWQAVKAEWLLKDQSPQRQRKRLG